MTTPNQPNDGHQNNGVTERIAPSPIPPRPAPRPGSAESGPQGGNNPGGRPHENPQQQGAFGGRGGAQQGGGQQGNAQQGNAQQGNAQQSNAQQSNAQQGGAPQGGAQQGKDNAPESKPGADQETARIGGGSADSGAGKDSGPAGGNPNGQAPNGQPQNGQGSGQDGSGQGQNGPQQAGPAQGGQGQAGQGQFQEGWSQLPQREPQSNLYRPGQSPVTGRPGSSGGGLGGGGLAGGGLGGGTSNARTTADLAAKAARKEAAMVKSVGIDGPTRSIARPELIKDMPDLSEIRHPLPPAEKAGSGLPPQSPLPQAVPMAVAAVSAGDPLRATVQIRRIDPWSTLKISLVISVALFFVWMLAVGLLYIVLEGMGVWERLNNTFTEMVSQDGGTAGLIDAGTVFGYAGVIGLINVVLFTALGTVGTFIYNQCCDLVGGIQVTLADPD